MFGVWTGLGVLAAAVFANAAVALYKAQERPAGLATLEGCYLEHLNRVIPYGDYYPEKSCLKYTCGTNNITQLFTCGVVAADKRCQLISNEAADYPDCCPREMCGTISPEYLTGPPDTGSYAEEEEGRTGPPATGLLNEEATVTGSSMSEGSEVLAPGTSEVKSLDHEGRVNELLIAQANSYPS